MFTVEITDYQKPLGGTNKIHKLIFPQIKEIITKNISEFDDLKTIGTYNLIIPKHNYKSGSKERIVIFFNGIFEETYKDTTTLVEPVTINGIENNITTFLVPDHSSSSDDYILFTSDEGLPIAQYRKSTWELNILFDIFAKKEEPNYSDELKIFESILKKFNENVIIPITYQNSWRHSTVKEILSENIIKAIKNERERTLAENRQNIARWESELRDYMLHIKRTIDKLEQTRRMVCEEDNYIGNIISNLTKDLDLLIEHEKIEDVIVKNNKFFIKTTPLTIHSDRNKKYFGGKYSIEIDIQRADVRFFGTELKHGYWTPTDPHPHVNGEDGSACLGNISSTIAELCSQTQLYALAMICIDFLESANTADSAGKNVVRWKEIDDDGNPIKKVEEEVICPSCGEEVPISDIHEAYYLNDDDEPCDLHELCIHCLEGEGYTFDEDRNIWFIGQ